MELLFKNRETKEQIYTVKCIMKESMKKVELLYNELKELIENGKIRESVELTTLSETIGHFPSTSIYEGNVGLASHNSGSNGDFFKNLKKIKIGSEIYYQTNYGTKRYVVTTKEIINEEDWSYLGTTEDNRITLITCVAGQKDKRLCVQAVESMDGMNYGQ